jgi:dTMP kinase
MAISSKHKKVCQIFKKTIARPDGTMQKKQKLSEFTDDKTLPPINDKLSTSDIFQQNKDRTMNDLGLFIAFEGIDGCGKTTLINNVYKNLTASSFPALLTKEPGGTPFGQKLRAILQDPSIKLASLTEILLFAADRTEHRIQVIDPALTDGQIVLSDRTYLSSIVYQGFGSDESLDFIMMINSCAMNNRQPDLIIYVDIDVDIAFDRINSRGLGKTRFEEKQKSYFHRIQSGYTEILAKYPNVLKLDGSETPEALTSQALQAIKRLYNERN